MKDQGLPAVTVVLTKLHAGGKFGGDGYKVSGGLHGVGVSVVNALSAWLHVDVKRDGKIFHQEFARGEPTTDLKKVGPDEGDRHDDHVPARPRDLRRARVVRGDPHPAPPRDRVPDQGPADRAHRRARGRGAARVLRRGRDQGLRLLRERLEGSRPQAHRLLRGLDERRHGEQRPGRGRDAVEHLVRRVGLLVREQHQHARGRLAPLRLQGGADANAQRLRAQERVPQGEGRQPRGRGRPRGACGRDLGQAPGPAVRRPDEDEAGQRLGPRLSSSRP